MIRDVVLHLANEQPLVADLFSLPGPGDSLLRCTNLRTLAGKRPVFADDQASVFLFPMLHLRFIEVLPRSQAGIAALAADGAAGRVDGVVAGGVGESGVVTEASTMPPAPVTDDPDGEDPDIELEIDEDFLRRVREA